MHANRSLVFFVFLLAIFAPGATFAQRTFETKSVEAHPCYNKHFRYDTTPRVEGEGKDKVVIVHDGMTSFKDGFCSVVTEMDIGGGRSSLRKVILVTESGERIEGGSGIRLEGRAIRTIISEHGFYRESWEHVWDNVGIAGITAELTDVEFVEDTIEQTVLPEVGTPGKIRVRLRYNDPPIEDPTSVTVRNTTNGASLQLNVRPAPGGNGIAFLSDPINIHKSRISLAPRSLRANDGDTLEATSGNKTGRVQVRTPYITPIKMLSANGEALHEFAEKGPYEVTLTEGKPDAPNAVTLEFDVGPVRGSGTISSDAPDVVTPTVSTFAAGGKQSVLLMVQRQTEAQLTIEWKHAKGTERLTIRVTVSPFDLDIEAVPEIAEESPGGYARIGERIALRITAPPTDTLHYINEVGLARMQGPARFFADPETDTELEAKWSDFSKIPKRVYVDPGTNPGSVSRIQLFIRHQTGQEAVDTVQITAFEMSVEVKGVAEGETAWVGRNDNDDNRNNVKDLDERNEAIKNEADLLELVVSAKPATLPFELRADAGLSVWPRKDKGGAPILEAPDGEPNRVQLTKKQLKGSFFLEGVEAGAPLNVGLRLQIKRDQNGEQTPAGKLHAADAVVHVVKADVDIKGLPDEADNEYTRGGVVAVVPGDPPHEDDLLELRLRTEPGALVDEAAKVRLSVSKGKQNIRLWKDDGNEGLEIIELAAGRVLYDRDELPAKIFVQGVKRSAPMGVTLQLAYLRHTNGALLKIHGDEIRITVSPRVYDVEKLTLKPDLIVIPHDPSAKKARKQLTVLLDTADKEGIKVTNHPSTRFRHIGADLANLFEPDTPIADIAIDGKGRVTVKSAGLNVIQAHHDGVESNFTVVLAGLQLKKLMLQAEGPIATPLRELSGKDWAVLTTPENGQITATGYVRPVDAEFSFAGREETIKLSEIEQMLGKVEDKLPPKAQALIYALKKAVSVGTNQFTDFSSNNQTVFTVEDGFEFNKLLEGEAGVPFSSGVLRGNRSGIASVEGTLDLSSLGLGKASGYVTVLVIPEVESFWVVHEDDEPGEYEAPIEIRTSDAAQPGTPVQALAVAKVTDKSHVEDDDFETAVDFVAGQGAFDFPVQVGKWRLRMTGEREDKPDKKGNKKDVTYTNVHLSLLIPAVAAKWHALHANRLLIHAPAGFDAFLQHQNRVAQTRVWVNAKIPLMTNEGTNTRSHLRRVKIESTQCTTGAPIFHFQGGPAIPALDEKFKRGKPFETALAMTGKPVTGSADPQGPPGAFPAAFTNSAPRTAGWMYFVEFPINDPGKCTLKFQESRVKTDAQGRDRSNHAAINKDLAVGSNYSIAEYKDAQGELTHALIFADVRGWSRRPAGKLDVDRVMQRVSVWDTEHERFRVTALWALQLALDGRNGGLEFGSALVGSSAGEVAEEFTHDQALDAKQRFQSIALPF